LTNWRTTLRSPRTIATIAIEKASNARNALFFRLRNAIHFRKVNAVAQM
jgi:hypothetical protein